MPVRFETSVKVSNSSAAGADYFATGRLATRFFAALFAGLRVFFRVVLVALFLTAFLGRPGRLRATLFLAILGLLCF